MMFGAMRWYEQEQEKRRDRRKKNDISLLNRRIQRLIDILQEDIRNNDELMKFVNEANYHTHTDIMYIRGCQQFESDEIAYRSLECLLQIIPRLTEPEDQKRYWYECKQLVSQLVNIDWNYNFLLGEVFNEAKRKMITNHQK